MARAFKDLNEQEVLALAISLEEEDARIYDDFAEGLKDAYPSVSQQFRDLRVEEDGHRHRLLELYRQKFGEHIPLIRRHDVKGFVTRKPVWLVRPLGLSAVRKEAELMELETRRFYERAARQATDVSVRQLLGDLAEEEVAARKRLFVLQVVQPGLAGLMDGSVSTLAPLFAAAAATGKSKDALLVGLAASVGAGISMGFAEALSDDGSLTGRGRPLIRGVVCGLMTALGGLGHSLPYLIPYFQTATAIAIGVVLVELGVIAYVRHRFMDSPLTSAVFQVVIGGLLVFLTGILIGSS